MFKKVGLLIAMCWLLLPSNVSACDACGCSISGSGIGMMTSYRNNYVRLGWQSARYLSIAENSSGSKDYFQLMDISAQYYLSDRWKVWGNLSYRDNHRDNLQESRRLSGLSDSRIMASYSLVNNWLTTSGSSWLVDVGVGLKLPSGEYDSKLHSSNLPENFNLGNGHVGFLFQPRVVFTKNSFGLSLSNHTEIYTASNDGYQYGHQFAGQFTAFKEIDFLKFKWIPQLGMGYEHIRGDQYKNGNSVHGTGGTGLFGTIGLSVKRGIFLVGINHSLPIIQEYSQDEVEANGRWALQASYIF